MKKLWEKVDFECKKWPISPILGIARIVLLNAKQSPYVKHHFWSLIKIHLSDSEKTSKNVNFVSIIGPFTIYIYIYIYIYMYIYIYVYYIYIYVYIYVYYIYTIYIYTMVRAK